MVDFVCVSPRSLKVKFKFEKVKICVVVTYDPSEGNVEESTIFWDNLNDVLDGRNRRFSSFATYLPIQGFFLQLSPPLTGRAPVSYTHLRAHETPEHLVCRLLLEKKNTLLII